MADKIDRQRTKTALGSSWVAKEAVGPTPSSSPRVEDHVLRIVSGMCSQQLEIPPDRTLSVMFRLLYVEATL